MVGHADDGRGVHCLRAFWNKLATFPFCSGRQRHIKTPIRYATLAAMVGIERLQGLCAE